MKVPLFDFQEDALRQLHVKLCQARPFAAIDNPQAVSFSSPTGSGKTIIMAALFEDIFFGEPDLQPQPDAAILWLSDMPELNEQTRLKIESKSDRIRVKQLVTINSDFDAERLEGGNIYFVNTQKLGTDKLLTRYGDNRQHTIWETLTNTAIAIPDRFYVVIDEAHRGMRTGRGSQTAQTIMQRFLLGSAEDGLCRMPLVIGISATPSRFEELLAGTQNQTVHRINVATDDVRASGLLKDRILIHYPDSDGQLEMSLLAEAARRWQIMERRWRAYCDGEKIGAVKPILVIQVEDGSANILTRTDLDTALNIVETAIGRSLEEGEVAHTFTDTTEVTIGNRQIRDIEASRIENDPRVRLVLFKMSLSTGWDCPRAEVMMSFRHAQDHTYIAQLLGRMVRTPLARHVGKDAALNDVHLFLPYYNEVAVNNIINDLQNVEDVPPASVGVSRELVTLKKREGTEYIFDEMKPLVTYRVNAVRKQSSLRRVMGLGRGLTHDRLDEEAQERVTKRIVGKMTAAVQALRDSGKFDDRATQITDVDLKTIALKGNVVAEVATVYAIDTTSADIDQEFNRAGRFLGNGLHMAYWKEHSERDADTVKTELIVLAQEQDSMEVIEQFAQQQFDTLYQDHRSGIGRLNEERQSHYNKLRLATADPQDVYWVLPDSISFRRTPDAPTFERHLYVEGDELFRANLGGWEMGVLTEELADSSVVYWLRNIDRQPWSFEIPYPDGGEVKPMFPDLLIVRKVDDGYKFDILEPHDPNLGDNAAKAIGLARFAEKHGHLFDRIELIRKLRGADGNEHFYRLDVNKESVRRMVLRLRDNTHLDQIFDQEKAVRSINA